MITDIWLNPITGTVGVLGYNQAVEEFPHELISFLQSSIVEADRREVGLLYRMFTTLNNEWESIYGKILALPDLYKPETVAAEVLEYLRGNVGISDNLNYIWGTLDELAKRRFIKNFIRFLTLRSTDLGILELFETMSGRPAELFSYFDYQWILSGEGEYNAETALGEEETSFDPWLISEYHEAFGLWPEVVTIPAFGATTRYKFRIDAVICAFLGVDITDPLFLTGEVPDQVRVTYLASMKSLVGLVVIESGHYYVYGPPSYYFGQVALYSTSAEDFRVGFEIDQYIYDICVMDDDETLSHDMCYALAKFSRASHERVYIRYYRLIELFDEDNDDWTFSGTSTTIDTDEKILILQ